MSKIYKLMLLGLPTKSAKNCQKIFETQKNDGCKKQKRVQPYDAFFIYNQKSLGLESVE